MRLQIKQSPGILGGVLYGAAEVDAVGVGDVGEIALMREEGDGRANYRGRLHLY